MTMTEAHAATQEETSGLRQLLNICHDCGRILQRVRDLQDGSVPENTFYDSPFMTTPPYEGTSHHFNSGRELEDSVYFSAMPVDHSLPHKATKSELTAAADSGCQLCKLLLASLQSRRENVESDGTKGYQRYPATIYRMGRKFGSGPCYPSHYLVEVRCTADREPRAGESVGSLNSVEPLKPYSDRPVSVMPTVRKTRWQVIRNLDR